MVRFSRANTKLRKLQKRIGKQVYSFDLLSGYSCPFAKDCKSRAVPQKDGSRKIVDDPNCKFRCYSASQEVMYKATFALREQNLTVLKSCKTEKAMYEKLKAAIPKKAEVIRVHSSGDFFSKTYFNAWVRLARDLPHLEFYAYTKAIKYVNDTTIPNNFRIVLSRGGTQDHFIDTAKQKGFVEAKVVNHSTDTALEVDENDYHAYSATKDFALVVHGTQPRKKT